MAKFYLGGWRRDLPDYRDYVLDATKLKLVKDSSLPADTLGAMPTKVSNRVYCSPTKNQGQLGSCCANAGMYLAEYVMNKLKGKCVPGSRLFLYKVIRRLMGLTGDSGADIRTTMKGLVLFGVPAEQYWSYTDDPILFDKEPTAFVYAMGQGIKATKYNRLNASTPEHLLSLLKKTLAARWTFMGGFTCYSGIESCDGPDVTIPERSEGVVGGHAIHFTGYDDARVCNVPADVDPALCVGAFEFHNSWGNWGDGGYGYLPYWYVLKSQADDFWTLTDESMYDINKID